MVCRLYVLCTVALGLWCQLALAVGPVVRCETCDTKAMEQCKPLPSDCPEQVREPLCGCCMTCALPQGSQCGVYSEKCGSGLSCQARPGELKPLQTLLEGRGVCTNVTASKLKNVLQGQEAAGNSSDSDEDKAPSSNENLALSNTQRVSYHNPHTKIEIIEKEKSKNSQRYKIDYDPQSMDTLNFSSEYKQETEYGPCRREMESILNHLKIMNVLSPRGFHIPNCDKKGFYKKKQCRPSKGRKRGNCWCVDKYGQPLPGYDGKSKGDVHCYNLEGQ
ncbi:insulin-like growth factor-binding protein 3 [Bombina bombina]|uniref:insulin-like growth factor-binding protein 3 n=1 Tax=Bombina bombina TaxID=8345 RepID=UPI00235A7399|nr:insulin-like growth factor-binding protein 3 [Bombina bombina]